MKTDKTAHLKTEPKNSPRSVEENAPDPPDLPDRFNILITNVEMKGFSGTTLFAGDLAGQLLRRGHRPVIYTARLGEYAQKLLDQGIPVTNSLRIPGFRPDVIHGHHMLETARALAAFPDTPALFFCHDHMSPHDHTPLHPRIMRYFGVSRLCQDRLKKEGVPQDKIRMFHNFVDTARFLPRAPLPERPARALIFSNYASRETHVPAVFEACRRAGVAVEVIGNMWGVVAERPEEILGEYDLIFAKAKAAMEAMAVGAAVILCDFAGVGPMVTPEEFERVRELNFGLQTMVEPLEPENVLKQIKLYDPEQAGLVRDLARTNCSLEQAVDLLVDTYGEIMAEYRAIPPPARIKGKVRFQMPYWKYLLMVVLKLFSSDLPRYLPLSFRKKLRTTFVFKAYQALSLFLFKRIL